MQFYSTYKGSQYINICKVYVEERFTSSKSGLDLASEHLIIIVFLTKKTSWWEDCRIRCFLKVPIRVQEFTHLNGMQKNWQVGNPGHLRNEGVNLKPQVSS